MKLRLFNTLTGSVTTISGASTIGYVEGVGTAARFNLLRYMALDNTGTCLLLTD